MFIKKYLQNLVQEQIFFERLKKEFSSLGLIRISLNKTPFYEELVLFFSRLRDIFIEEEEYKQKILSLAKLYFKKTFEITFKKIGVISKTAEILGRKIVQEIERGLHYKKVIFRTYQQIKDSNFFGFFVCISGALGKRKKSKFFFQKGNVSSRTFEEFKEKAQTRAGSIGIYLKLVKTKDKQIDEVYYNEKN